MNDLGIATEFGKDKHGNIYYPEPLYIPRGRCQYLNLTKPSKKFTRWGVTILWEKKWLETSKTLKAQLDVLELACEALYDAKKLTKAKREEFRKQFIIDGDMPYDDMEGNEVEAPHPGYYFVQVDAKEKIEVVGADGKESYDAGLIKPGMFLAAMATPMLSVRGIGWKGKVAQFIKDDGVRFQVGPDPKRKLVPAENLADDYGEVPQESQAASAMAETAKAVSKEEAKAGLANM